MSPLIRLLSAIAALTALIGCAGGNQPLPQALQLGESLASATAGIGQRNQPRPQLTREILDGLDGSFMEVTVENTGAVGYLFVQERRQDSFPGTVWVWRSEDNVTFAMRRGVLVQTRGFGNDILATSLRLSSGTIGPVGDGQRTMSILGLDNKAVTLAGACDVGNQGSDRITIIGRSYPTQRVIERCEFTDGQIQNDYWIDSGSDIVWQSRQWAGPDMGYLRFRRLTR